MRRTTITLLTLLAVASISTLVVWAGSPHFISHAVSATCSGPDLDVTFKEAGLESGNTDIIQVTADGTATYQCINGGGINPNDPKKTTVSTQVSTSGTFTVDHSGNIIQTLTLTPPAAPTTFSCPPGQTASGATNVSYSNVLLKDNTSGALFSFATGFTCP